MSFEKNINRGVFFGFIPRRLEIDERPDLCVFPFNVLFAQYKTENEKTIIGSALYEPDLNSLQDRDGKSSMYYHNVYGGKSCLFIEYDLENKSYVGKKIVEDENVGIATGMNWNMFFSHFTALGLANGEKCKFEEINN